MKIQKQFVNKRGNKSYYKYVVVISPKIIEKSGLKEGQELEAEAKEGEVRLRKR